MIYLLRDLGDELVELLLVHPLAVVLGVLDGV
jgi:hypothetical protein